MVKKQNILITGGSGLVGRRLTQMLQENGYEVSWLSHSGKTTNDVKAYKWDIDKMAIDTEAIETADIVIHLVGEGIANGRWTSRQKQRIFDSRIESTKLLHQTLNQSHHKVQSFISASAIGYYGMDNGDRVLSETAEAGTDFLAKVTQQWEQEVDQISSSSIKVVKLRLGVVLSEKGGALEKIALPIRWGMGTALGRGDQFMSWIHIDDLCRMIEYCFENDLMEVYNAVTPNPVTNKEMTKEIASQLGKPYFLPNIPYFVLKILLGEMADMLLGSSKVSSKKIEKEDFEFHFPSLQIALENLLR